MTLREEASANGYASLYSAFDSPLRRKLRQEAYGEDIGQHSWVTANELRLDFSRLALATTSRLLDLGCGPGGPLVFAVTSTGCTATGLDVSAAAIHSGRTRASAAGVQGRVEFREADLNLPIPLSTGSFDAVMCLDVVLHVHDRASFFKDIARLMVSRGKLLLTDAGVVAGPISNEEIEQRSVHGYAQFVPPGVNEALLEAAGFRLVGQEDRTESVLVNANGRLRAMLAHRAEIEATDGAESFARQQRYVETVIALSERRALSRLMYFAETAPD